MNNKRGMALIVALLSSFILLALVASLFWVIASTSRQAEYARNSAIALNLAEAGTADAIYRLNYCTGTDPATDLYPFLGTHIPFDLTGSDIFSVTTDLPELPPAPASAPYAPQGIKRNLNDGYYVVGLLNDATGPDTLVAVGIYKGVRRTLTIPLRGNNDTALARHPVIPPVTQGISEAFNKHVIYANTITGTGNVLVNNGNIVYTTDPLPILGGTNNTKTKVDPALFGVCKPDTGIVFPSSPNYEIFFYNGYGYDSPYDDGTNIDTIFYCNGYPSTWGAYEVIGITVSGTDYIFTDTPIASTESSYYAQDGNGIIFAGSSGNTVIHGPIGTAGTLIRIEASLINLSGSTVLFTTAPSGVFTINNGADITGFSSALKVLNASIFITSVGTIFTNAAIMCNGTITISGDITIENNISPDIAAILSFGNPALITVDGNITVTSMGPNQHFLLLAYDAPGVSGTAGIIIGHTVTTPSNWHGAVATAYSFDGTATDTILNGATIGSLASPAKGELIYAYGGGSTPGGITFTNGTVNGTLVTNGTVNLTAGTLNYVPSTFQTTNTGDIFSGFSGGRRAYVPTWQGWRLR